jgi:hypothetical protein
MRMDILLLLIVGSALSGLILAPLLRIPSRMQDRSLKLGALAVSFRETVIPLVLWNLLRRGQ